MVQWFPSQNPTARRSARRRFHAMKPSLDLDHEKGWALIFTALEMFSQHPCIFLYSSFQDRNEKK